MEKNLSASQYALGNTDSEHERLARQAARFDPYTERFFRDAGISSGQRVLELGSGAGDVAMLVARIVGPTGAVLGVERDSRSIQRARVRVEQAGLRNVSFTQADVAQIPGGEMFDAAVGRFILQFVSEPAEVLRSLSASVRPGGVIAFQEASWAPFVALCASLPLWSAAASLAVGAFRGSGARTEMGAVMHQAFQDAALSAPKMHIEMPLGSDAQFAQWLAEVLQSLRPQIERLGLMRGKLGDFETLAERLHAELEAAKTVVPSVGLVGAWSLKPAE